MDSKTRLQRKLRIDADASEALLNQLDADACSNESKEGRCVDRQSYRKVFRVELTQPEGPTLLYAALTRNVSESGIGFVIGQFVYSGATCRVFVDQADGAETEVKGTIRHCRYLAGSGHLYEVGVAFDEPFDMTRLERAAELACRRLLLLSDDKSLMRLVGSLIRGLNAELISVGSPRETMELALSVDPDLLLVDTDMPGVDGPALVRQLRDKIWFQPIMAFAGAPDDGCLTDGLQNGYSAVLQKPVTREALLKQIAVLIYPQLFSDFARDPEKVVLVDGFVETLSERLRLLEYAFVQADLDLVRSVVCQLQGHASESGFAPIAQLAGELMASVDQDKEPEAIRSQLDELVRLCRAAQPARDND